MAKFEFRLQSVLNLREKLENQKELEYGLALKKLERERELERSLRSSRSACVTALAGKIEARIDPEEIARYNEYINVLKDRIAVQIKVVKAAADYAENKRLELVEAMRERKTLERLRENQHEEYIEEEKRDEQKQVDQTVSYKYAKTTR